MMVLGVVIALGMVIVSVGATRGAAGVAIAAFIVLGNAGSNALAETMASGKTRLLIFDSGFKS
jgi:hypothetical protein